MVLLNLLRNWENLIKTEKSETQNDPFMDTVHHVSVKEGDVENCGVNT